MAKVTPLTDVTTGLGGQATVNTNNQRIEDAFENTLSRDGSSPNEMNANLDMNGYQILNAVIDLTTMDFTGIDLTGATGTDLSYAAGTQLLDIATGMGVFLPLFTNTEAGLTPLSGGGTTAFLRADGTWAVPPGGAGTTNLSWNAATSQVVSDTGTDASIPLSTTLFPGLLPTLSGSATSYLNGVGAWSIPPNTLGTDGDKGDITVGASGTTLSIDNDAVTYAKIQNVVSNNVFLGRISGAGGDIEELTVAQAKTLLSLTGTNSGDVTLAAIGAVPNANAATLTGQVLNLQPASATFGGVVTTGVQTFAGAKTLTGILTTIDVQPTATSVSAIGTTNLHYLNLYSDHANIIRIGGPGNTGGTSINAGSSALGCTVLAANATSVATVATGGSTVGVHVAAAAWAGPAGSNCTVEILGTSGTNFGSSINLFGAANAVGTVRMTALSSGSMNFGSVLLENATLLSEIIIIGDGVFNFGNCRRDGGTITISGDTAVNLGTLLGGTLTISGNSSFNLGTVESSGTLIISGEGCYNQAHIVAGTVTLSGDDCFNIGAVDAAGSTITLAGDNVQNFMSVGGGADLSVTGTSQGVFCRGLTSGLSTITMSNDGTSIQGYFLGTSTTNITASGIGANIYGAVDLSASVGAPGTVTMLASAQGSTLFGSVSSVAAGLGSSTMNATGIGSVVMAHIPLTSSNPALVEATSTGSFAGGACAFGITRSSGLGTYAWGYTSGTNAIILAGTLPGAIAIGQAVSTTAGAASLNSTGTGSSVLGSASNTGSGAALMSATNTGSFCAGTSVAQSTVNSSSVASGQGSTVIGRSASNSGFSGLLTATATAATAIGNAQGSTMQATGTGAMVQGQAIPFAGVSSVMTASGNGSKAMGQCTGSTMTAGLNGSTVFGYAVANSFITALPPVGGATAFGLANNASTITATGDGSFAIGYAVLGNNITAGPGAGAFAIGDTTTGAITATGANSVQFGVGVNAVPQSVQVGTAILLHAARPVTPAVPAFVQDGSIWVDSVGVFWRQSGGVIAVF